MARCAILTKKQEKGGVCAVFKKKLFKAKIIENGYTIAEVAGFMGINPVTLYRKMDGKTEFTRSEIQLIGQYLALSAEDVNRIFFAS